MSRLLFTLLLCLSSAHCAEEPTQALPSERPNILIFIADDLGWNDIGPYGNRSAKTPNIDALAEGGLRFDNVFLTTSSCSPSRASILTGRYPSANGLKHLHQSLPANEATVARSLRESGYYTASVGKWHIGRDAKQDFDLVIDDRGKASGSTQWLQVLRERPTEQPFFFWFASRDPHRPYNAAEEDLPIQYAPHEVEIPLHFIDGPKTRQEFVLYYNEVTRFDHYIGLIISELEQQNALDNTLIIVMSDNGRPFHRGKITLYDDGIKTPFIVHWPSAITEPGIRKQLISSIDIVPGLLELAQAESHNQLQGNSFIPALHSEKEVIREYAFAERNWHGKNAHERAVRSLDYLYKENQHPLHGDCYRSQFSSTASFKELKAAYGLGELDPLRTECFNERRPSVELFEIVDDEQSFENIGNSEKVSAVKATMAKVLKQWREENQDPDYRPHRKD